MILLKSSETIEESLTFKSWILFVKKIVLKSSIKDTISSRYILKLGFFKVSKMKFMQDVNSKKWQE